MDWESKVFHRTDGERFEFRVGSSSAWHEVHVRSPGVSLFAAYGVDDYLARVMLSGKPCFERKSEMRYLWLCDDWYIERREAFRKRDVFDLKTDIENTALFLPLKMIQFGMRMKLAPSNSAQHPFPIDKWETGF